MSVTPTKPVGAVDALNAESPSTPSGAVTGDDVIPLLLAVNPGIVVNYKRMAALDPKHRTWSSWEHKFRKLKARGKELAGGAAGADDQSSKAAGDMEETVILLIAANPGISFDYRQIAALDLQGRTYYSWEHRFRKWRASAKELVEQSGEAAGGDGDVAPVKKAKRARAKNGEDAVAKVNSGQKRQEAAEDATDGSPSKKARGSKKGTARVVKKTSKKPTEIDEEIAEDNDSDEIAKPKGKARSKGNAEKEVKEEELAETQGEGVKLEHEI